MRKLTYISIFVLVFIGQVNAQITIERQVIGSTGGVQTGSNHIVSSNVGETAVQTLFGTNSILTQGFLQPRTSGAITYEIINESCNGANNGAFNVVSVTGCQGPYTVEIFSIPDSTVMDQLQLGSGDYLVSVTGGAGCGAKDTINIGLDSDEDCALKFYSGITPNGDGDNDKWIIDNIELFPENDINIYNRWGVVVWSGKNYNNNDIVWEGKNSSGEDLPDGTYFYVAKVNGETYKRWVEITR